MRRNVLLRHELGSGEVHFDWMIDPGAGRELITFRVMERLDLGGLSGFTGTRIGDHRRLYLDYEGPISGGRGRVSRVACGAIRVFAEEHKRLGLVCILGSFSGAIVGWQVVGAEWEFQMLS